MLKPFWPSSWKSQLPALFFIFSCLVLVYGLLVQPFGDPDVYLHLRDGRYWVENHFQVDREPFAYTVPDAPFEKVEWLFRIGFYLLHQAGGIPALIAVKAGLMTLAVALLGWLIYRRWQHWGIAAVLLGLALLAPMTRIFPERPYVFTYLFLPLTLLWLENYRRSGGVEARADQQLWKIPVLVLLWANLHPGFMALFVFLGAYIADEAWTAWRWRDPQAFHRLKILLITSTAALAAGCATPMGFGLYPFTLNIMRSHDYMAFLTEWMPPRWQGEPLFFILLGLAWLAQVANWRKLCWRDFLPLLIFSYSALKSYRNMPIFLIAALPPLASNLQNLWQAWKPKALALSPSVSRWGLVAGGVFAWVVLSIALQSGYAFQGGEIPRFYPKDALKWIEDHHVQGRLLTHDIWGGYTGWITHGRVKVFMDGRMPTFGEKIYADYRKIIWGSPGECLPLLDRYQIEGVLVSPKNDLHLFQRLWASGIWTLIYWDDVSLLYVRRQGLNAPLATTQGYSAVDPRHVPYFNPAYPAEALVEIVRAETQAPESFLPYFFEGDLLLRMGKLTESRTALEKALKLAPGHAPSLLDTAALDYKENRPQQAEAGFRRVLAMPSDPPVWGMAAYHLSLMLAESSEPTRRAEALRWAELAAQWMPEWAPAQQQKQRLQSMPQK